MLGIAPLLTNADVVTPAIVAIVVAALTSGIGAYFARPKTRAEADNLNATASVSMSAEARQWTKVFVEDAAAAKADAAAAKADAASAEARAEKAEGRADEIEAGLIECYGYVRLLREDLRAAGQSPRPLPARLEALWRATGH